MSDDTCGCCDGLQPVTPRPIFNRPGLDELARRVGEYADFYETLLSRISTQWVDVDLNQAGLHGEMLVNRVNPLRDLRTRANDDPTIALLDAWAVVADVLTFYSERIANEGYLRTSGELRSLIELARLVGYRRRPGVAASVYLAFTADSAGVSASGLVLPAGARVQSTPDPGLPPQTFETDAPLLTRPEWSMLTPRQVRPAYLPHEVAATVGTLYFKGTATNLSVNSALLLIYSYAPYFRLVAKVTPDFTLSRTAADLVGGDQTVAEAPQVASLRDMVTGLEKAPSIPPASPARLGLSSASAYGRSSAAIDGLLARFHPAAARQLPRARANAVVTTGPELQEVLALRVKASVYANAAQLVPPAPPTPAVIGEAPATSRATRKRARAAQAAGSADWDLDSAGIADPYYTLDLDTTYDAILPGTWVVVLRPNRPAADVLRQVITQVKAVQTVSRTSYNFPAKVTRLILADQWLDANDTLLSAIRPTTVYAAPEPLVLADAPLTDPICGQELELDQLVDGLQPGRWLIVTGERANVPGQDDFVVEGIPATELAMLSASRQDVLYIRNGQPISVGDLLVKGNQPSGGGKFDLPPLPNDKTHTFLTLSAPLAYCYKRDTVKVYANVAHATHGETQSGALGAGDGSKTYQTFDLKGTPPPLTYTAAIASNGVASSLKTYVNDVRWHEAENSLDLGPATHGFLTVTDEKEKTSVVFGDGVNGARLPTAGAAGQENVRAIYRRGIGKPGNVREAQINRLVANVDGMRAVINPQPATGGADPDGADSTRRRTPLAVTALDRLVGVEDYADFARLFAGIGKASAARLATAHGHVVHVTIAGVDDIPIDATSDLYRALLASLEQFGDPYLPVQLERRALSLLLISTNIQIDPDYEWETVEAAVRAALLAALGFDRRELGQDAYAAEALAVIQAVPGVQYADLDLFAAVPETIDPSQLVDPGAPPLASGVTERIAARLDRIDPLTHKPAPAGLVILSPDVPTSLLLSEVPHE